MQLESFTEKVRELAAQNEKLNAKVRFVTEEGVVFLDATQTPPVVTNDADAEGDCDIRLKVKDGLKMLNKDLSATTAFMVGKLKVSGDMGIAMKVAKAIG